MADEKVVEDKPCEHKFKLTNSEPSPYWVRLTHVCEKCASKVVSIKHPLVKEKNW